MPVVLGILLAAATARTQNITLERFSENPIIHEGLLPKFEGDNINGPTLIRVPDWVDKRLGKYYLYFAHHKGKYIRLAFSDKLEGPWKIYKPGVLRIEDCICSKAPIKKGESLRHHGAENAGDNVTHVASPDIIVDDVNKQLIMYYHCPLEYNGQRGQYTISAVSKNGIDFKSDDVVLGEPYFRVFKWDNYYYAIGRSSSVYRSKDPRAPFEKGPNPFVKIQNPSMLRHTGLRVQGDTLWVFYSRVGDEPERILLSKIRLTGDWNTWVPTNPVTVAQPETEYEGADLPVGKSKGGLYYGRVRQLRDPYLFEEDGKWYLLYSTAGENGIGIGKLNLNSGHN